jgi:ketosteroid isomerase-like protein
MWRCRRPAHAAILALALLAAGTLGAPSARAAGGAEAAIRQALERWREDFNSKNTTHVCDLFAPDLIASFEGQPEHDFTQVCNLLTTSLENPERRYLYSLDVKEIIVSGDLAVVRLVWTLDIEDKGGARQSFDETGLDVFRSGPDGRWRIIRFIGYSKTL